MTLQLAGTAQLDRNKIEKGLHVFVEAAFVRKMPRLIPFVMENTSLLELAKQLKRREKSPRTLYQYVFGVRRFCRWARKSPDQLVAECRGPDGEPLPRMVSKHVALLEDFVGILQDEGLASGTTANHAKGTRMFYRANGLRVELPYRLSKKVKFKDRSPSPDELQRVLDLGDLRGKVIVSMISLGGFREGTLCQLQYRHVKKDLERGMVPVHIHVEQDITKGKYGDFDSFLGPEVVEYLRLYLDGRRRGSIWRGGGQASVHRIPPEEVVDCSPVIRDEYPRNDGNGGKVFRPITPGRVHDIIHDLYVKAGLIGEEKAVRYPLRAHSLRKYFKTQLLAHGVQPDYLEYMMGHVLDTYHDVQSLGVEFLRNIYAVSGLSIRPRTQLSQMDMAKKMLEALGVKPEELLTREAQSFPHRTYASPMDRDGHQLQVLTQAIKEAVKKDLIA